PHGSPMSLPLSGLLVVALEQAVAAPMCTCRLADADALVITIDRREGDFARGYDKLAKPHTKGRERPDVTHTERAADGAGESAYFVGSTAASNRWCSTSRATTTR